MKILFLHGRDRSPAGFKPTCLARHGHQVRNPVLSDDDWDEAVRTVPAEYDRLHADVISGCSDRGALARNLDSGSPPQGLLCPAWKPWGWPRRPSWALASEPSNFAVLARRDNRQS